MPNVPTTPPDEILPAFLDSQIAPPPPDQVTGIPTGDTTTFEKAWLRYMQRIGVHNVKLYKDGGAALNSVSTLMRSHGPEGV